MGEGTHFSFSAQEDPGASGPDDEPPEVLVSKCVLW